MSTRPQNLHDSTRTFTCDEAIAKMCKMAANGSCMRGKGTQVSVPMRVRRSAGGHCVSWHQAGKTLRERQARRHDETAKQ